MGLILASVSFCPLLIIESVARVPNMCFSRTTCSLIRYIRLFELQDGVFSQIIHFNVYIKKNYNPRFCKKKSTRVWGILNNYKEKLNAPRVHTAALIEF